MSNNTGNILTATSILTQILQQALAWNSLIGKARAEGRDITAAELDGLRANDDAVRAAGQALRDQH